MNMTISGLQRLVSLKSSRDWEKEQKGRSSEFYWALSSALVLMIICSFAVKVWILDPLLSFSDF
jgi:hypothetical protein